MSDTTELKKFLLTLEKADQPASGRALPLADRKQDKARQKARELGYAFHFGKYQRGNPDPKRSGWVLTENGRAYLRQLKDAAE